MVGTRSKPIQYTAQPWQSESDFDGMRHTGDLMIFYVVICCLYHISAETPWHRISLKSSACDFRESGDSLWAPQIVARCYHTGKFGLILFVTWVFSVLFTEFLPPTRFNTFSTRLLEQALPGGSKIWNPVKRRLSGHHVLDLTISICFNLTHLTQRSRFCFSCFNDVECKHVF